MIFGLNNSVDKFVGRLNDLENAIKMSADLAKAIKLKGDVTPEEFLQMIMANQASLAAKMVDKETFNMHVDHLNDVKGGIKVLHDFKK